MFCEMKFRLIFSLIEHIVFVHEEVFEIDNGDVKESFSFDIFRIL